jgi:ABC-type branched-subunit amino acid transport system ATPase component/branched-subunit amino acid ABC-type transport system permease component
MNDILPFVVIGIATGSIGAGLLGVGLVLTYKTSGIFNFAHGAIATVAAYAFYYLHVDRGMGWLPAAGLAVVVLGPVMGLLTERVARRLASASSEYKIVGTIGIVLLVQALATIKYGSQTIRVAQFLPNGSKHFKVLDVVITYDKVYVTMTALVSTALLYALFRFTRAGLAMRAVVEDPDLVAMQGVDPARVRQVAWVIGATFASLSGVLVLPFLGLDSILLSFLVVQAFGAAVLGAFSSIPLTFLGGILIGIGSSISTKYVLDAPWLRGLPASLPFLVLLIGLLLIPRRRLVPPNFVERRAALQYRAPTRLRLGAAAVVLVPLLFVPGLVGDKLIFYSIGLVTVVMLLSLGLLVRTSGQVSLCHAAFAAVGAVTFSQLHVDQGWPWILAILVAGLAVVPVGILIALPATRLSGLFLALATFGFGILVQQLCYGQSWMFTLAEQGRTMPRPSFADTPKKFYYVLLTAAVLAGLLVVVVNRSRLGRVLQGMSHAPTAVTALGLSTNVAKVVVFALSSFMAGIAGALYGVAQGVATGNTAFFNSFHSLILLVVLAIAPLAEPWYAFLQGIAFVVPGYLPGEKSQLWIYAVFGLAAVFVGMEGGHRAMPTKLQRLLDRLGGRRPTESEGVQLAVSPVRGSGLKVQGLSARFGGLIAVNELSFSAPVGQITGLVGPNGAGKTTVFNTCSGLNRRFTGRILLHDEDITRLPPGARGRRGLGRTFQRMELADSLSVLANVALGHETGLAGANPFRQLAASRAQLNRTHAATWSAMRMCAIDDLADAQVGALSTGQRRLVELARVLAGPFDMLLLDEPTSGLDRAETARLGALLTKIVRERGVGVLLVEHDMSLVTSVSDSVYVLDFGQLIFEGTPEEMRRSDVVRAAYLGSEALDHEGQHHKELASHDPS